MSQFSCQHLFELFYSGLVRLGMSEKARENHDTLYF